MNKNILWIGEKLLEWHDKQVERMKQKVKA